MPTYSYQATDSDGQINSGELEAESVAEALGELESRGLIVDSIVRSNIPEPLERPSDLPFPSIDRSFHGPSSLEDHFDAALQKRDALMPALTALADDMSPGRARTEIRQVVSELAKAASSNDLRRSDLLVQWLPLLSSGFTAESTTQQLTDLMSHASRESANRRQRRRLLAYPLAVAVIAVGVFVFLSVIIVPTFASMYRDFGMELPPSTRFVIYVAEQIQHHPFRFVGTMIVIAGVGYAGIRAWLHFALTTRFFGLFSSGNTANVSAMSSLTSRLADLLSIGVSVPDALWIAGQGCGHYHFQRVAQELARDAHGGRLVDSPLAHNFPANVVTALRGDDNGKPNVPLLRELSLIYSDRVDERVDWGTSFVAQFAIVGIGIVVGFIVLSLFLPLVSLISGLT